VSAVQNRPVQATRERLLARTAEGDGSYYEFLGYLPGRAYKTWAWVAERGPDRATLVLPEWHPAVPVPLPSRLLPADAPTGAWMELGCDLGASGAGRLQPHDMRVCEPPPAGEWPPIRWLPPAAPAAPERPVLGRGCGDLVADLPHALGATPVRGGYRELLVAERPPLEPGARIYLSTSRGIAAYLKLVELVALPCVTRLVCEVDPVALAAVVEGAPAPVSERCHWRWWPRSAEGSQRQLERYAYDADEHAIGYVWRHRPPAVNPPKQ